MENNENNYFLECEKTISNNFYNPFYNSCSLFINKYDLYKNKTNREFRNYIINNFNIKCIFTSNGKISVKLTKICNIKIILNNIKKTNNYFNDIEYYLHKKKISKLIDKILLIMSYKAYYFDFNENEYELYELDDEFDNQIYNESDDDFDKFLKSKIDTTKDQDQDQDKNQDQDQDQNKNQDLLIDKIYFIKIKNKKNLLLDYKNITKSMWLFHKDILYEYIS
jgi:hypothetical protein